MVTLSLQVNIPQVHTEQGGELLSILNLMLAQAINLQDRSGAAQIREALRCISLLDQVTQSGRDLAIHTIAIILGHPDEAGLQSEGGVPGPVPIHRLLGQV